LRNLDILRLGYNKITKIENLDKLIGLRTLSIYGNLIKGPITTLEKYREYIKISYELEWIDYFMIIAIINERFIDIYRMFV
jgi:Leucine Rich repeats (2 copies)